MTYSPEAFDTLPRVPAWVARQRADTLEEAAFMSGAALSQLHPLLNRKDVPQTLARAHLALQAAEVCTMHHGRPERAGELRDALAFLRPGDHAGPAGEIYRSWQRMVDRPVSVDALRRALPEFDGEQIAIWLDRKKAAPVSRAADVLEVVRDHAPRRIETAILCADAVLAQSLRWRYLVPLLGVGLRRADLRQTGHRLRLACHQAVVNGAVEATRMTSELTRNCARLHAAAPKLRAKGAEPALSLFLKREAVAPTELTMLGSDRAARRFCDRLVKLGVAREVTGRDTFRLFGL